MIVIYRVWSGVLRYSTYAFHLNVAVKFKDTFSRSQIDTSSE